jgi:DNA (cytosine-5)-methyltransferase 1
MLLHFKRKQMKKYKIINLYACLGGNRYKWDEVAKQLNIELEVTAVELDPELARMYQERFPNDIVIVSDAHQYLLDHYKEFDFIWSSPPCPTHSKARFARHESTTTEYPDMKLYQEIIFLENYFKGKYVVENVVPFYTPLIPSTKRGRHLYWTNFNLPNILTDRKCSFMEGKDEVTKWQEFHKINLTNYKGTQRKDKIARNLVDYEAGRTILETALGIITKADVKQNEFDFN